MVVALIALCVSLGGSAYAANMIHGKLIKNGTVTGKKLKNGTVTGKKVKRDTLAGRQIKESRLGPVPRAARADHALRADTAGSAQSATTASSLEGLGAGAFERSGSLVRFATRMQNTDPERTLFQAGPFTVKASCVLNGSQNLFKVWVVTSENDAAATRHNIQGTFAGDVDLDIGEELVITQSQEAGTPPNPSGPFRFEADLFSAGGTHVLVTGSQGGRLFSANESARVHCTFAGYAIVS